MSDREKAVVLGADWHGRGHIQAFLVGDEPSGMSLTKLCKGVPERWEEQRGMWSAG